MTGYDSRRAFAFGVLPLLLLAGAALPVPLLGDRLPGDVATHWNLDGEVDGTTSRTALWLVPTVALALAAAVLAARLRGRVTRLPEAVPVLAGGAFAVAVSLICVLSSVDAARAADVAQPSLLLVLAPVAAGALGGAAGWWAERGRPWQPVGTPVPAPGPAIEARPGEQVVWSGHGSGPVVLVAGALAAALVAGIALTTGLWPLLLVAAAVGLAAAAVGSVHVVAGPRGLDVRLGPLGLLRRTVPAGDIASAEPTEIRAREWGGYGWRVLPGGRSALVLRGGPGLLVHLRDGRRLAITVDDPASAAAVVNASVRAVAR